MAPKRVFLELTAGLAAVCLLAGACSPGASTGTSESTKGTNAKPTATLGPSPFSKEYSAPKVAPPPVTGRTATCVETFAQAPKATPAPDKSFVIAVIDPNRGFGENCNQMAPGGDCWIPITGGWRLVETPQGSMVFQVFENDGNTPVRSPEAGPIPHGGQFSQTTKLHYKVGVSAKTATIRALLKDATGRVVAKSEPQTVDLPVCFAER